MTSTPELRIKLRQHAATQQGQRTQGSGLDSKVDTVLGLLAPGAPDEAAG